MSIVAILHVGGFDTDGKAIAVSRSVELEKEKLQISDGENTVSNQQNRESVAEKAADDKGENEIDIILNNVVCVFDLQCRLNLEQIAARGKNLDYDRQMANITMRFKKPACTATIRSTGKITMMGATTESDAKTGARQCGRTIQKLGFEVKFTRYRIVNVFATCTMPFGIKIMDFAQAYPRLASYEPELNTGVTFKMNDLRATSKIFSSGSVTVFAPSIDNIRAAMEQIYTLVFEFKREGRVDDLLLWKLRKRSRREQCSNRSSKKTKFEDGFVNDVEDETERDERDVGSETEENKVNAGGKDQEGWATEVKNSVALLSDDKYFDCKGSPDGNVYFDCAEYLDISD